MLHSSESLLCESRSTSWYHLQHIEPHSLGQWPKITNNKRTNQTSHTNKQIRINIVIGPEANLHWPMMTWSPSLTRKHGETWAGMFECLFSYLTKKRINTFLTSIQKSRNYTRMLPLILLDKVEVVPSYDDGPLHLGAVASTS